MTLPGFLIAGLHKLTALDYPGVVSAIVFTQGCNFQCPYCHNPELIPHLAGQPLLDSAEVLAFLEKRFGLLDGLVISGGEPCLQPGLPDFCREVKKLGYSVKLDTNGSRSDLLERLLADNLVDYVAMDCKTEPERYDLLCAEKDIARKIVRSADILRNSGKGHEFRTTCIGPFVSPDAVSEIAALVGESAWYFQKGNLNDAMERKGLVAASLAQIESMAVQAEGGGARACVR